MVRTGVLPTNGEKQNIAMVGWTLPHRHISQMTQNKRLKYSYMQSKFYSVKKRPALMVVCNEKEALPFCQLGLVCNFAKFVDEL